MSPRRAPTEWIEIYNGMLTDEPPRSKDGRHHAYLFINRVRVLSRGIVREPDVQVVSGESKTELSRELARWVKENGARLLASRVEMNGEGDVPASEPARSSLLDGTDPIYGGEAKS